MKISQVSAPKRPLLRYHGGKWQLAPWIIAQFPEHRIYIEPFGGAASILLRKPRSFAEVYNDLDSEVVNVFRVARDCGHHLVRALELTPFAREEFEGAYEPTEDPVELARRTIVRSFQGFGSDGVHSSHRTGFRGRSQRSNTTPAHDWHNYPDGLRGILERLRGVVIEHQDACHVIERYDEPAALHYVDPPYLHSTRKRVDRARGYRHEMTDKDHRKLLGLLNRVKGAVVLSGYPSPIYDKLCRKWERLEKTGPFADGAAQRTEVLWLRNVSYGLFAPSK